MFKINKYVSFFNYLQAAVPSNLHKYKNNNSKNKFDSQKCKVYTQIFQALMKN